MGIFLRNLMPDGVVDVTHQNGLVIRQFEINKNMLVKKINCYLDMDYYYL